MSRIDTLPTLTDLQRRPRARPKPSTRLARAVLRAVRRREDARKLAAWAKAVKDRDGWQDRRTGQRVHASRTLDPQRAEAHHIVSRDDKAVKFDVRNGVCLSFETHYLVERNELRIEGTKYFTVNGCRYIDATFPIFFVRI